MLKTAVMLAVVAVAAHMAMTIYTGMKEEDRYFKHISSGKFLTEKFN